jgi:hypothetical protein
MGDYSEKKLLAAVGVVVSILGGVLLLMAAGSAGLGITGVVMGVFKDGLLSAAAAVPIALAGFGCIFLGLALRLQPLTPESLTRSAGEAVSFLVSVFWTMRITSGVKIPAWEIIAYLLVLSGFFILNINRFIKPDSGERPAGK